MNLTPGKHIDFVKPFRNFGLCAKRLFKLRRIYVYAITRSSEKSLSYLNYLPEGCDKVTVVQVEFVYIRLDQNMIEVELNDFTCTVVTRTHDRADVWTIIKDLIREGRRQLREKLK